MMADHSPRSSAVVAAGNGGVDIQQSRMMSLSSAWTSVVKGDSEIVSLTRAATPVPSSPPPGPVSGSDNAVVESLESEMPSESYDVDGEGNAGGTRRPVWNKPVNGVIEVVSVMGGAVSWPALSESTRPLMRSSSVSSKPGSDGSAPSFQAPLISQPPKRQANSNAHINSTTNTATPVRTRSRTRGGGGGGVGSSGSGPPQTNFFRASPQPRPPPPPPPPFPFFEFHHDMIPSMLNTSVRSMRPVGGEVSQPLMGNDHSYRRNMSRKASYGTHLRGDGSYHNNKGGQRDQNRRDAPLSLQYGPPPSMAYLPPPPLLPGAPSFMGQPPVRIFPGQMSFDMMPSIIYVPTMHSEAFMSMPMVPPPSQPLVSFPLASENLSDLIITQIEYYFSVVNLVKDKFLRSNMDDHGWVSIILIASFPRVQQLTRDISLILESLKYSSVVEVEGDRVRKRHEWKRWLNPSDSQVDDYGPQSPSAALESAFATSFQAVSLDDGVTGSVTHNTWMGNSYGEIGTGQLLADELTGQSGVYDGDNTVKNVHSTGV